MNDKKRKEQNRTEQKNINNKGLTPSLKLMHLIFPRILLSHTLQLSP